MGIADRSGEVIFGTSEGVTRVRDVKSKESKEAWKLEKLNQMRGVPWEPDPGRQGIA